MNLRSTVFVYLCLLALTSQAALQRSDLSPAAQVLVPDGGGMVKIVTRDGKTYEGIVSMENSVKIMLKFKRPGGIFQSLPVMKSDIRERAPKDITSLFFKKLMEYKLQDGVVLPESQYRSAIELFDEFIEKAPDYSEVGRIRDLRSSYASELANLGKGLKKVGSEWTTPVRGTVKEFDLLTSQMKELEERKDFRTNEKVKAFHQGLMEKRREAVRSLPGMVRSTVPNLISSGEFETAVNEVVSFMQFWCDQVVRAEGPAASVIKQMDFGQIVQLEKMIMDAYVKAGKGREGSSPDPGSRTMVYIPGGYFLMGKEGGDFSQPDFPLHIVYAAPFMIGKYEVTNREYRKFIAHVKTTADSSMDHPDSPLMKDHEPEGWKYPGLSRDDQPVVGVDWFDAYAYCKWKGLRLPTEAEWEKAARTMDARKFPWGDKAPEGVQANYVRARSFMAKELDRQNPPQAPRPQGGCACVKKEVPPPPPTVLPAETWDADKQLPKQAVDAIRNDFMIWKKKYTFANGIMHMAGNAAEWVYDFYDPQYYWRSPVENPKGPAAGKNHVFRGGSYLNTKPDELAVYERGVPLNPAMESGCMHKGKPFIGFRVVRDLGMSGEFYEEQRKQKSSDDKSFDQFMDELNTKQDESD